MLQLKHISKQFTAVRALNDVTIEAQAGEIVGLIGVNGAGKSTLMNILGGVFEPTEGQILIDGEEVHIRTPQDAEKYGIGFIHQEPVMFGHMTVAENISVSRLHGGVNYRELNEIAAKYLKQMNCDINPRARVADLPIGQRQMVEIARALSSGGKILLFDEPTASFTDTEKQQLFEVIRGLKAQGVCIFFISHFLDEVAELTDRTIVLRDGRKVIEGKTSEITRAEILRNMIGGDVVEVDHESAADESTVLMRVKDLSAGTKPAGLSFDLHKGEVVCIWGLMGSGRTETLRAIYGLDKITGGEIEIDTGDGLKKATEADIRNFCGYVTEARHDDGCLLPWPIWENMTAPQLQHFTRRLFLDEKKEREESEIYSKRLNVKTPSVETTVAQLSGGNQQKVIMAKWLMKKPRVFLIDEPTRGVDVGAKAEIQKMIRELAREGSACLVVSSEIEEISQVCDRVIVLNRGKLNGELRRDEISKDLLMHLCV